MKKFLEELRMRVPGVTVELEHNGTRVENIAPALVPPILTLFVAWVSREGTDMKVEISISRDGISRAPDSMAAEYAGKIAALVAAS